MKEPWAVLTIRQKGWHGYVLCRVAVKRSSWLCGYAIGQMRQYIIHSHTSVSYRTSLKRAGLSDCIYEQSNRAIEIARAESFASWCQARSKFPQYSGPIWGAREKACCWRFVQC